MFVGADSDAFCSNDEIKELPAATPSRLARVHPPFRLRRALKFAPSFRCPTTFGALPPSRNRQSVSRDIFGDRRSRGDIRTRADAHRRNQGAVAADEYPVSNGGVVLGQGVVVAGDRARAAI